MMKSLPSWDPFGNATHTALSFRSGGRGRADYRGPAPSVSWPLPLPAMWAPAHVVITDVNDYRLGLAAQMGATEAINVSRAAIPDTIKKLGMKEGFDVGP